MNENRREIIDKILKHEGYWNRDENSYRGIMPATYEDFQSETKEELPHNQLPDHPETVYAFYEWYLKKYHTWDLPDYFQYMYADFVVNAQSAAIKILQLVVGTTVDGVWGGKTSQAVAKFFRENTIDTRGENFPSLLVRYYDAARRAFYLKLACRSKKFERYLDGWLNRCDDVLRNTLDMLNNR